MLVCFARALLVGSLFRSCASLHGPHPSTPVWPDAFTVSFRTNISWLGPQAHRLDLVHGLLRYAGGTNLSAREEVGGGGRAAAWRGY